ncbi:hypothetical protein BGZ49_010352 [Haplosporangium sp. Z 27]|nr:hypothetical protein BGZ49_010352 [Haplosporangium sp. Z 27]
MESTTPTPTTDYQQELHNTQKECINQSSAPQTLASLASKSTTEPSTPPTQSTPVYCCCLPVSTGVWIISLVLTIPGIALVICFNVANFQGLIKFNSPAKIKIFYTVIYSLYALLGVIIGVTFRKLTVNQRLKSLIILYWVLIVTTIIEGIYFGIIIAEQKSKLIGFCDDGGGSTEDSSSIIPTTTTTNSTSSDSLDSVIRMTQAEIDRRYEICHGMRALIGVFYVLGPGGWIILHIAWILIVVLYSKVLRDQSSLDEEMAVVRLNSRSIPSMRVLILDNPKKSISSNHKDRSTQQRGLIDESQDPGNHRYSLPDRPMSRTELDQSRAENNPLRSIDSDDISSIDQHRYLSDSDDDKDEDHLDQGRSKSRSSSVFLDESMSSRADIPLDGKGWWIRQIEGKRRGEICPCALPSKRSHEIEPCWCGKERSIRYSQTLSMKTSTDLGSSAKHLSI